MNPAHGQAGYSVRFDWGMPGARAVVGPADVAVVVDVLSFTTTLSVAGDAGTIVLPYRWRDESAAAYARRHDATLAVGRSMAGPNDVTLSPVSVRRAPSIERLVLPSPNGSTIAHALAGGARRVVGACLRNASAVARWIVSKPSTTGVAVIAAGERWPDEELRPAVEDLWGAGAVVAALVEQGRTDLSPEARTAATAYRDVAADLGPMLAASASGRELAAMGFGGDVDIAAEAGTSDAVPVMDSDGRFCPVAPD